MDEELIIKFLEQIRKDKFDVKEIAKIDDIVPAKKVFFNDDDKTDSLDSDDEFLEAFENFAEIVCPKVDRGELKCDHMNKPVKEKKSKIPHNKKLHCEKKRESLNYDYHYKPERRYTYEEERITITDSLKTMRELRIRDEELKMQCGKP
uniref:Protein TSSC4 n=1 Tax=Strongyloides papillosus TaxID=174720 RepID=A0A0N5B279_STREA